MPIYEYKCEKCQLKFELKRRFGEDGTGFCPECGSEARRLFSPVPIVFKGSGFYITDNRKNSERGKDEFDRFSRDDKDEEPETAKKEKEWSAR